MTGRFQGLPPLDTLVAFESVARLGSFTKAADELCVTQSAVSKQVKTLEKALGVELFLRAARGVLLTAAGEAYIGEITSALQRIYVTGQRLKASPNTVTVLATHAVSQFWLFPRLLEFNAAHPEITIHIHASNDILPYMVADYDLAILYGDGQWPTLHSTAIVPEVIFPVARPGILGTDAETLKDLAALPLIQLASTWNCIDWSEWFGHLGFAYQPSKTDPTFNQLTLTYAAILQGTGIGLVWDFMTVEALAKQELVRVTDFQVVTGLAECIVSDHARPLSPAARVFCDWLLSTVLTGSAVG